MIAAPCPGRTARLARAAASGTLLGGLLFGMPYVLAHWGSGFLPRRVPSVSSLLASLEQPLPSTGWALLVLAGWTIWAVLGCSTAVEVLWHARHLPDLLRRGDLTPVSARTGIVGVLVATLVLGLFAGQHAHAEGQQIATTVKASAVRPAATAPAQPGLEKARNTVGQHEAFCTVERGDTLWDLARRHLGNPLRWQEIYELNHGVTQDDGGALSEPDLVYPGWTLRLPTSTAPVSTPKGAGAKAEGVGAIGTVHSGSGAAAPSEPSGHLGAPAVGTSQTREAPRSQESSANPNRTHRPSGVNLPGGAGVIDVALLATVAGLATLALSRRRSRPHQPREPLPYEIPEPSGPEEDPLTCALRHLARTQVAAHVRASTAASPVAVDHGGTLGLDELLDQSPGGQLSLTGPGAADVVRALIASVVAAEGEHHEIVIPAADLTELAPALSGTEVSGVRITADADDALAAMEAHAARSAREVSQPDPAVCIPRLVLIGGLTPAQHARLTALLRIDSARRLGAVHPEPVPGVAGYIVDEDGTTISESDPSADSPPPAQLKFFHLRTQAADTVLRLIRNNPDSAPDVGMSIQPPFSGNTKHQYDFVASQESSTEAGDGLASNFGETSERAPQKSDPPPPRPGQPADSAPALLESRPVATVTSVAAPVRLTLLGQFAMTVRGTQVERGIHGNVGDLLAYLAIHRQGRTKETITTALWPIQDGTENAAATFDNTKSTARSLLRGALDAGRSLPVFVQSGGLWRLDPNLYSSDLDDLRDAFQQAHTAGSDVEARLDACRRIVGLSAGELHAGSDAEWLEIHREDLRRRTLDALAILAAQPGLSPEETLAHLSRATELDPYNDQLYLRQARLHGELGRPEAVRRTLDLLKARCSDLGVRPSPGVLDGFDRLLGTAKSSPPASSSPRRPQVATRR